MVRAGYTGNSRTKLRWPAAALKQARQPDRGSAGTGTPPSSESTTSTSPLIPSPRAHRSRVEDPPSQRPTHERPFIGHHRHSDFGVLAASQLRVSGDLFNGVSCPE